MELASKTSHGVAAPRRRSYAGPMTDVEGGLDEPEELQPEPGALALASADDDWSRADWEQAAAGVLRKARRLGDDDPDSAVWRTLPSTTLDGIDDQSARHARRCSTASSPAVVRRAPGAGTSAPRSATNADALADLEGGVTSLWVRAGSTPDWDRVLDGVVLDLAPVVLDGADAEGFLSLRRRPRARPRHQPRLRRPDAPTSEQAALASASRRARLRGGRDGGPRPRCLRRPGARLRMAVGAAGPAALVTERPVGRRRGRA